MSELIRPVWEIWESWIQIPNQPHYLTLSLPGSNWWQPCADHLFVIPGYVGQVSASERWRYKSYFLISTEYYRTPSYWWWSMEIMSRHTIDILQWRHNECDGVSNHRPRHCLLNRLFERRSKKISKLRVTGQCAGKSSVTGEFPAQMASNAENVSVWWHHHERTYV